MFKEKFIERYKKMMPDWEAFAEYSRKPMKKSIRINTLKSEKRQVIERLEERGIQLTQMPWYEYGFFADGKGLGNTLEHVLGYFYIQEAASMIPPLALGKGKKVLDMCASPGSKTTQMSMMMGNKGLIIANDIRIQRITPLRANLQRSGCENVIVSKMNGVNFSRFEGTFDRVLLDAPCSATGSVRKNWDILKMWNPKGISKLARIQKQLAMSAYAALEPKGEMVYSTCTLEPEENEGVMDFLLEKTGAKLQRISIGKLKTRKGLTEFEDEKYSAELKKTIRIYPQDNDTGGFYLAKVKKK